MKFFTMCLALSLCLFALSAKGQGTLVTVNGTNYDISEVTGTFNDLQIELEGTPWWGSETLALNLDFALPSVYVPALDGNLGLEYAWAIGGPNTVLLGGGSDNRDTIGFYTIGEIVPAPEPSTFALLSLAACGIVGRGLWSQSRNRPA